MKRSSLLSGGGSPHTHALREAMGAGCVAALDSIAKLIGGAPWRQGLIEHVPMPRLRALAPGDFGALGVFVGVSLGGTVGGLFAIVLDTASAKALGGGLTGTSASDASPELLDSALSELCNIAACSFGIAIQSLSGGTIMPSVPNLVYGELASSVSRASEPFKATEALTVQFLSQSGDIAGRFVWTLGDAELASLTKMLERTR